MAKFTQLIFATLQDHDGHGPEFLKHMHRINSTTGAHLSVSFRVL